MRRTPAAASSRTGKDLPLIPTMKLNGFETAVQTVRTAAMSGNPGANNTSAPTRSKACRRRMRIVQVRRRVQEIVRSCGQEKRKAQFALRFSRCRDSFHGESFIVKRLVLAPGRILDGASHEARVCRKPDRLSHLLRRVPESPFQIRRHWQIGRVHDDARVRQRLFARQSAVPPSNRNGRGRARGCERLKSEAGENASGGDIPGIRNDEDVWSGMKRAKNLCFSRLIEWLPVEAHRKSPALIAAQRISRISFSFVLAA